MIQIQVTLVLRTITIRVFAYPRFISVSWGTLLSYPRPNFKAYYLRQPSPGLSGNVMQMISLSSKNRGASLTSKW
jgi:hypothetical protein